MSYDEKCAGRIINAQAAEIEDLRLLLVRCRTVLGNMARENPNAIFFRWPIHHEPLRNDARGLLPIIDEALSDQEPTK